MYQTTCINYIACLLVIMLLVAKMDTGAKRSHAASLPLHHLLLHLLHLAIYIFSLAVCLLVFFTCVTFSPLCVSLYLSLAALSQ